MLESEYINDASPYLKEVSTTTTSIVFHCKKCSTPMKFDEIILMSMPAWYPHTCPSCLWQGIVREAYPKIVK